MKRYIVALLAAALLLAGSACSVKPQDEALPLRVYAYRESDDTVPPRITIEEDGRFQFSFSVISSYIGTGTYVQDGDLLVLHTDDGKYYYAFQLADDGLVFDADSSSDFLGHADIPDGAVFQ